MIAHRGLRPASELAATKPHGTRLKYMGGCRCEACRASNTAYERGRQQARAAGDWNGIVDATPARDHLRKLHEAGVGKRAVEQATDIGYTILTEISVGTKLRIRARTERLILEVNTGARLLGEKIPAADTWLLINELLAEGFTKAFLGQKITGGNTPSLQLNRQRINLRSAIRVRALHRELMTTLEARHTAPIRGSHRMSTYTVYRSNYIHNHGTSEKVLHTGLGWDAAQRTRDAEHAALLKEPDYRPGVMSRPLICIRLESQT